MDFARERFHPDILMLPEMFQFRGKSAQLSAQAEPISGFTVDILKSYAKENKIAIHTGSLIEQSGKKLFNTSIFLSPKGKILSEYRKVHLFKANLKNGLDLNEAHIFQAGHNIEVFSYQSWCFGMSICYDLRFPELFRKLSNKGAEIIFVASNFTTITGKAHWETLLRARAIENQAYVIASNQCGRCQDSQYTSYGNSMIIDPWGSILTKAGQKEEIICATIDRKKLNDIRTQLPALKNRIFKV